jgi:hypothetical protein
VQLPAVEAEGCRREPDDLEVWIDGGEVAKESAVHGIRATRDQMRLIDQDQIGALDVVGLAMDRLVPVNRIRASISRRLSPAL